MFKRFIFIVTLIIAILILSALFLFPSSIFPSTNTPDTSSENQPSEVINNNSSTNTPPTVTKMIVPAVRISKATNINETTATLNSFLSTLGDFSSVNIFFRYREKGSGESFTETNHQILSSTGNFNQNIKNLKPNTTYEFRVVVRWKDGIQEDFSDPLTFTTPVSVSNPDPEPVPSDNNEYIDDFVYVNDNGQFELDGQSFKFAGTNAYFLPNYEKLDSNVVDNHLEAFESVGINVVRMWAFYDGYDCGYSQFDSSENVIQTSPGVYDEEALKDLDNVIAKGKEKGIKFVLPFINFWDELGGICQYNYWTGQFETPEEGSMDMEFFMANEDTQKWYRDYISMLLNRVNTVTGVAYKDEPAILSWQIINEGRNPSANPTILRDWYQDTAQYIKSIDSNHLLSTGEEGFDDASLGSWDQGGNFLHPNYTSENYSNTYALRSDVGSSYILNTAIPEIDIGWAHWYPSVFGFGHTVNSDMITAQHAWLSDHKNIATNNNKPFVLGEYGIPGSPWADANQKYEIYSDLHRYSQNNNIDGTLIWQFIPGYPKCTEYGGNICYPGRESDEDLYNDFIDYIQTRI